MESHNVKELTKKQELNNHIVSMRKCVRQAKVHVIRKLTREVKKLRERKGSEENQIKSKRKADRLYLEISAIKHLKEDKVSISALQNSLKLEQVLQNPKSTEEERSIARLSHHPSVNKQVENYRQANPSWKLKIPVLLEKSPAKLKKSQKKEEKKKQQNSKNKTSDSAPDSDELLTIKKESGDEEHVSDNDVVDDEAENSADDSSDEDDGDDSEDVEEEPEQEEETEGEEDEEEEAELPVKLKKIKLKEKNKRDSTTTTKAEETKNDTNIKKDLLTLNKTEGTIKVQVIKDWSEFLEKDSESNKVEISNKSETEIVKKPKSSFFLGGVDEKIDNDDDDDSKSKEQRQYFDNSNRRSRRNESVRQQRGPRKDFQNTSERPFRGNNNNNNRGPQNRSGSEKFNKFDSSNNKKDFKQGRPPRYFDKKGPESFNDKHAKNPNFQKPIYEKKNIEVTKTGPPEKLHPSWEAKKRQSATIPSFQGKKIKFDE